MAISRNVLIALCVTALVAVMALTPSAGHAADAPPTLSDAPDGTTSVSWSGLLDSPAPMGCGQPNLGCDVSKFVVEASKGSWLTVAIDEPGSTVRVTARGELVGAGGQTFEVNPSNTDRPTTTFKHVDAGRVTYTVTVGNPVANSTNPVPYTATAALAGEAYHRAGDCAVTTGTDQLSDTRSGKTPVVHVRLVADPDDEAAVREAGRTLKEIYARIAVPVSVSYDFMPIIDDSPRYPYEQVRRHYGGVRPAGVDVVHVMTDLFAGGYSDCRGGIAYEEKAFSVGNVHYSTPGGVPVDAVPAGMVAAHEIGHLLGAEHQQSNCVEAVPQQVEQPASDGWTAPCTIMSPTALQASETFSTLESATIRHYVRTYAGG